MYREGRGNEIPGARPANSTTLMPFSGGGPAMMNIDIYDEIHRLDKRCMRRLVGNVAIDYRRQHWQLRSAMLKKYIYYKINEGALIQPVG
jgi:hypothetical protein